jgi:alginate O-acetyltransferase complex protein AlgI
MPFASSVFLLVFLPVVLLVHATAPLRLRGPFLLAASILFYAWGAPRFVFVVILTTFADFYLVRLMAKSERRAVRLAYLWASIGLNLSLLAAFKYGGFIGENVAAISRLFGSHATFTWPAIVLPLGISFYTFETITYVVDVYHGVHPPLTKPWLYQLYIFLFPKMMAGPIVRFREIADQLPAPEGRVPADLWVSGFFRMCLGLGKKVLLANPLSEAADWVYGNPGSGWPGLDPSHLSAASAWLAGTAFALQVYFDFSGYSDMAAGIGRMLGFRLPENFDHPFTSPSVTVFWRRWHMTLGGFMREYLYFPLRRTRAGATLGPSAVLALVFLTSGLWHGAAWTFVAWGGLHAIAILVEQKFDRFFEAIPRFARVVMTSAYFVMTMVVFRVSGWSDAVRHVAALFGAGSGSATFAPKGEPLVALGLGLFFAFFALSPGSAALAARVYAERPRRWELWAFAAAAIVLLVISLAHLTGRGFRPFVYFRF